MPTLGEYIKLMDALEGVELTAETTATDLFLSDPETVYRVVEIYYPNAREMEATKLIGLFSSIIYLFEPIESYEVPSIELNNVVYTTCEPLLMEMAKAPIPYGEIDFGNCIEAFGLIDGSTHPHRAMPMVLAYLYEGKEHPVERARIFLDMDFQDALSAYFFFASLGTGFITHLSNQQKESTEPNPTKQQANKLAKLN